MGEFISALHVERGNILSAQHLLSRRLTAIDAVLAVYQKSAGHSPETSSCGGACRR
jgi:hypothetical protein